MADDRPPSPPPVPLGRLSGYQGPAPPIFVCQQQQAPLSIPILRFSSSAVLNADTNQAIFIITTDASSYSSTVLRAGSGQAMGTIVKKSSTRVGIALAGARASTSFKYSNPSGMRQIFECEPQCFPGMKWYWSREKKALFRLADDAKKGQTIATLEGDVLMIGTALRFGESTVDEIVLSSIAMLKKDEKKMDSSSGTSSAVKAGFKVVELLLGGGIGGS